MVHIPVFMLLPSTIFIHNDEIFENKLQETGKDALVLEILYATRTDVLPAERKHLPVQRQQ